MSSLFGLLLLPVAGPVRGFQFVLEQLREEAEAAQFDEGRIQSELVQLGILRDLGELDEDVYAEEEQILLERLAEARAYRESFLVEEESGLWEEGEEEDT